MAGHEGVSFPSLLFSSTLLNEGHILEEEGRNQRDQRKDQDRYKAVLERSS